MYSNKISENNGEKEYNHQVKCTKKYNDFESNKAHFCRYSRIKVHWFYNKMIHSVSWYLNFRVQYVCFYLPNYYTRHCLSSL